MNYTDNDLLLIDRLGVIKDTIERYGADNFYLSFSGGKDSTVLHYLLDEALPGNTIPRVFMNTGIEYWDVVDYVKQLAVTDPRIQVVNSGINIKSMLEEVGYPFKSKDHAKKVDQWQRHHVMTKYLKAYLEKDGSRFTCPNVLRYQFTEENTLRISHMCCKVLKKDTLKAWEKKNGKTIAMTGIRRGEGGERESIKGCAIFKGGILKNFHPLLPVTEAWENWYIERRGIRLCRLYYVPFNFERTGCKGCPFALSLQEQLEVMERYMPAERKQCEYIWAPVYAEYRRLGYRLKKEEQLRLL